MIKYRRNFHLRKSCIILTIMNHFFTVIIFLLVLRIKATILVCPTQLCRFYFLYLLFKQSSHDNQVEILISGKLEDIKHSSTSVITLKHFGLSNYVFSIQHYAHECLIHILDKCFPDIDQSIFQKKMIEPIICGNTNNPDSGCGGNWSLKEVNSQNLRC